MLITCSKCEQQMRVKKIGVSVLEHANGIGPYRLWAGDEYECPVCGSSFTLVLQNALAIAHHYEPKFRILVAQIADGEIRHNRECR